MECEDGEVISEGEPEQCADANELEDEDKIPRERLEALGTVHTHRTHN